MLSLSSLAGWEDAVLASIAGASGTPEERYVQIERSGMYGEYPAILRAYAELFDDPACVVEAVKRAVFLVWRGAMASPDVTGLAALPESTSRDVIARLDDVIRHGLADDELAWMMAWYRAGGALLFDLLGGTPSVQRFGADRGPEAWRQAGITADRMRTRGQLGRYWTALAAGVVPENTSGAP